MFKSRKEAVDVYEAIRTERLDLERQARELKTREEEVKQWMIDTFTLQKVNGAFGTHWKVEIGHIDKATLSDPPAFFSFCVKKNMMGLPYKRINLEEAGRVRDAGIILPGVDWSSVPTLHYRSR